MLRHLGTKVYFDTIVVCEVNEKHEKRGNKECQMDSDIKFTVGGISAADTKKIKSIASYLKKEICVQIPVPEGAQITKRKKGRQTSQSTIFFIPLSFNIALAITQGTREGYRRQPTRILGIQCE